VTHLLTNQSENCYQNKTLAKPCHQVADAFPECRLNFIFETEINIKAKQRGQIKSYVAEEKSRKRVTFKNEEK